MAIPAGSLIAPSLHGPQLGTEMANTPTENREREKLTEIGFDDACSSIRSVGHFPGDLSDREHAQQVRVVDLSKQMIAVGIGKTRSQALIAEATETPVHVIRQWTRYIT